MGTNKDVDIKEVDDMSVVTLNERYCTVQKSMIESFKEVKLMREGTNSPKSWKDFFYQHKSTRGK